MKQLLISLALTATMAVPAWADMQVVAFDAAGNTYAAGDGSTCADALQTATLPHDWVQIECVRPVTAEDECAVNTVAVERLPGIGLVCIGEPK